MYMVLCTLAFMASPNAHAQGQDAKNIPQKTLRIAVTAFPNDLGNPYGSISLPSLLPGLAIYDPLFKFDEAGNLESALVDRWKMTSPTTWRFYLRKDVMFSNGEPFNASAIVQAFDHLTSKAGLLEVVAQLVVDIQGAYAIDDTTVEIETKAPNVLLPRRLAGLRIPAPRLWSTMDRKQFSRMPSGTGPFKVVTWTPGKVTFAAHRASWRAPVVDQLELLEVPDMSARVQALRTGAVDIAMDVGPEDRAAIEAGNGTIKVRQTGRIQTLAFVSNKPSAVADVRVRQALNYAIDKQRIVDVLLAGTTTVATQGAVAQAFGYDPSLTAYPYDPAKARAMLKDAGYENGFDILISFPPGTFAAYDAYHQQIVSDLRAVGVRATIEASTFVQHITRIRTGGWPGLGFAMDFNNMPTLDALWSIRIHSCMWSAPWHCRPEWTPLIQQAETATTIEERLALTRQLLKLYHDEPTGIFLWEIPGLDGVSSRVVNYKPGLGTVNLDTIDVLKSTQRRN
jgi:peptide/nickel transport system substrate-binding protein